MPNHPETTLQISVMKLARRVILGPYRIRAFDRSRDFSGRQHLNEANRGIRTGTPDVELIHAGRSINTELKAPGTRHLASHQPTEAQEQEMAALRAAGALAAPAWSLVEVVEQWTAAGVPLARLAREEAAAMDALILSSMALKGAAPTKRTARAPKAKPRAAVLKAEARQRGRGLF